jgi:hypothetical protein
LIACAPSLVGSATRREAYGLVHGYPRSPVALPRHRSVFPCRLITHAPDPGRDLSTRLKGIGPIGNRRGASCDRPPTAGGLQLCETVPGGPVRSVHISPRTPRGSQVVVSALGSVGRLARSASVTRFRRSRLAWLASSHSCISRVVKASTAGSPEGRGAWAGGGSRSRMTSPRVVSRAGRVSAYPPWLPRTA